MDVRPTIVPEGLGGHQCRDWELPWPVTWPGDWHCIACEPTSWRLERAAQIYWAGFRMTAQHTRRHIPIQGESKETNRGYLS